MLSRLISRIILRKKRSLTQYASLHEDHKISVEGLQFYLQYLSDGDVFVPVVSILGSMTLPICVPFWPRGLKTRGPWWSYIAHLSKQLCILTVEVSAKFTALRFLYKFYSPAPQRPCFFHASWRLELNIERGSPKEQFCRYIEIGPVVSDKKIFKMSYIDI